MARAAAVGCAATRPRSAGPPSRRLTARVRTLQRGAAEDGGAGVSRARCGDRAIYGAGQPLCLVQKSCRRRCSKPSRPSSTDSRCCTERRSARPGTRLRPCRWRTAGSRGGAVGLLSSVPCSRTRRQAAACRRAGAACRPALPACGAALVHGPAPPPPSCRRGRRARAAGRATAGRSGGRSLPAFESEPQAPAASAKTTTISHDSFMTPLDPFRSYTQRGSQARQDFSHRRRHLGGGELVGARRADVEDRDRHARSCARRTKRSPSTRSATSRRRAALRPRRTAPTRPPASARRRCRRRTRRRA